ncbi:hypothetical protein GCM10022268_33910 [Sphingomonas cynarae]|uniref:Glycosyltransferase RgtA/B/C/D-like domain-containing protein n=2 Tax=Sphingomonas cynarae TaxID=930197 RepID=A0ABP7ERR7_9SPHN
MLHGAVPYIDLWDRKPIGLFLLYAGVGMLPGDGIIAYQLIATLFAAATAITVAMIAQRIGAGRISGCVGGLLYLLTLSVLGGQGGQSPVFYNLFVAMAALLTTRLPHLVRHGRLSAIGWNGLGACALVGLAIQFKYTAAVEGALMGGAHVWAAWRLPGVRSRAATIGWTVAWMTAGLLPTIAVVIAYADMGASAFHAFWFANFISIALRRAYPARQVMGNLGSILGQVTPLLIASIATLTRYRTLKEGQASRRLVIGWLIAAVAGFAAIGTFHDHYALPLLPPLAALGAVALARSRALAVIVVGAATLVFVGERASTPNADQAVREAAALVQTYSGQRCPYVFMGDPIIYHLAGKCIPTAYAFPNTLAQAIEQNATGVDEAREVRRIMSNRPPVVVSSDRSRTIWNVASAAVMRRALASDYYLRKRIARGRYNLLIYVRRDRKRPYDS